MKKVKELKKWIELYNEVHAAAEELQLAYDLSLIHISEPTRH